MKSRETSWDCCTHAQEDYFEGEMVETRSYSKKLFFMVKFPEFLGSTLYFGLTLSDILPLLIKFAQYIQISTNNTVHLTHLNFYPLSQLLM